MAGDWIKMRCNLWDDPRVARICDLTESSESSVIGGLYWLWATADQHSEDGLMPSLTIRSIDRKTQINGLGTALVSVGWLVDTEDGVRIVRFEEHNGKSAKRRCSESVRKMSARDADKLQQIEDDAQQISAPREREDREKDKVNSLEPSALVVSELTPCPHQEIILLFAEHLPNLPQVRKWEGTRARHLKARWVWVLADLKSKGKPFDKSAGLDFFCRMFDYIGKSDFLMGKTTDWSCPGLPWIVSDENFTKIIEGNYENKAAA